MWLWKTGRLRDASKISLRGAKTRFMGQAEPRLGRAVTCSKDQPGGCSATHQTEAWSCSHLTNQDGQQKARPEHEAPWGINGKYRAMTEESALPSITSMDVASKNRPCCRRSRCWWSVVQTLPNRKSAWKRQYNRVRACNQSDNAGSDRCERVLLKTCCRNSYCESLHNFLCQMGLDLTKDAARSIPCELPRQLMFQKHPKLLAEIPCNLTLFVMLNLIP